MKMMSMLSKPKTICVYNDTYYNDLFCCHVCVVSGLYIALPVAFLSSL